MKKKKEKLEYFDDGRVIANMNIEGMPRSVFRRSARSAYDEFGKTTEKKEVLVLSRKERFALSWGVISSHIIFALAVFGFFALFILFCVKVWFK